MSFFQLDFANQLYYYMMVSAARQFILNRDTKFPSPLRAITKVDMVICDLTVQEI